MARYGGSYLYYMYKEPKCSQDLPPTVPPPAHLRLQFGCLLRGLLGFLRLLLVLGVEGAVGDPQLVALTLRLQQARAQLRTGRGRIRSGLGEAVCLACSEYLKM